MNLHSRRHRRNNGKSPRPHYRRPIAEQLETRRLLVTNLGTGGGSLIGNDLTDLGNNGIEGSYVNPPVTLPGDLGGFDAVFFGDDEPNFNPPNNEGAFNVFDNLKGGGQNKWCCNSANAGDGVHVGADFTNTLLAGLPAGAGIVLTHFTITSDNDSGINRDPDIWSIQGSNDGSTWTDIFSYNIDGNSPFDDFGGSAENRTLRYDGGGADFATPAPFHMIRYLATSSVNSNNHALGELEFFGTVFDPTVVIDGTSGADRIVITKSSNDQLRISVNSSSSDVTIAPGVPIEINGMGGDDEIIIAGNIDHSTTLNGDAGDDYLAGGGGNDVMNGGAGDDVMLGGAGDDTLDGGADRDRLDGGDGGDVLNGGGATDSISGGAGDDTIDGGSGNDVISGGLGSDIIVGGTGNDTLEGQGGDDVLDGGDGNDRLFGRTGDDVLLGGSGLDSLRGGSGSDLLISGQPTTIVTNANRSGLLADWLGPLPNVTTAHSNAVTNWSLDTMMADDGETDGLNGDGDDDGFVLDGADTIFFLRVGEPMA